jgi:uncharacterized membrane protein (Fun14 family)
MLITKRYPRRSRKGLRFCKTINVLLRYIYISIRNRIIRERGYLHSWLIIFAFGVKQCDFGQENVRPPRDWTADDVKSNISPNYCSRLVGAGVVFVINYIRVIRKAVKIIIIEGAVIRIAVLVLFAVTEHGTVHIAVCAISRIFIRLFQHALRLTLKMARRRTLKLAVINFVVRI